MTRREWLDQLSEAAARVLDDLRGRDAPSLRRLEADVESLYEQLRSELAHQRCSRPRVLVCLRGTALMHATAVGHSREERVAQVRDDSELSLHDYAGYVPTEGAVARVSGWSEQGAEISYLSSRRDAAGVAADSDLLRRHGFPRGAMFSRATAETYSDVATRAMPDILIEDDCESSGAQKTMYPQIAADARAKIRSIIVPEYGGLSQLPESLHQLLGCSA